MWARDVSRRKKKEKKKRRRKEDGPKISPGGPTTEEARSAMKPANPFFLFLLF